MVDNSSSDPSSLEKEEFLKAVEFAENLQTEMSLISDSLNRSSMISLILFSSSIGILLPSIYLLVFETQIFVDVGIIDYSKSLFVLGGLFVALVLSFGAWRMSVRRAKKRSDLRALSRSKQEVLELVDDWFRRFGSEFSIFEKSLIKARMSRLHFSTY